MGCSNKLKCKTPRAVMNQSETHPDLIIIEGPGGATYLQLHAHLAKYYTFSIISEAPLLCPGFRVCTADFLSIAGLEFFYAQSPHKMRGMMVGLFFFTWGAAEGLTQVFITAFSYRRPSSPLTCDFWYYLLYLCIAILGCVAYAVLVRRYTNRQRGEQESDLFYRPQD